MKLMRGGYQIEQRGFIETFFMRLGLAAMVIYTLPNVGRMADLTEQSRPSGLAHFIDLTFLADPTLYQAGYWLTVVALIAYVLGLAVPISLGIATVFHILVMTLYNSQGSQTHQFQIISLALLAQWIVYLVGFFRRKKLPFTHSLSNTAIHFSVQAIAAVYVIAGVIKMLRSKGMWAWQSPDIAVELMKTNAQKYYEYLEVDASFDHRLRVATWLIENPWLARIALGGGLMIELFAFLALYNRTAALIVGFAMLALHWGIEITMGLDFKNNSAMIWIFLINVPFWILWLSGKIAKRDGALDLKRSADFPWKPESRS